MKYKIYLMIYSMWFRFPMAMLTSFGVVISLAYLGGQYKGLYGCNYLAIGAVLWLLACPIVIYAWLNEGWRKPLKSIK